jgi:2-amino-4-hydroxy-6-hydroxymethyldihydropteridine diphosphokinase
VRETGTLSYFVALGSNLGDREKALREAWRRLEPFCGSMRLSRIHETRPLYVSDQPLFLNAVGQISTHAGPRELLTILHRIENELGRDRSREIRMGPRTLDLDILICGDMIMNEPSLVLPHPRLAERLFVLIPLLELSPGLVDPRSGRRMEELAAALRADPETAEGVYLYSPRGYTDPSNREP